MKMKWPEWALKWKGALGKYRYALLVVAVGVLLLALPSGGSREEPAGAETGAETFDLDAFEENYRALRSRLREDTKLLAVVKADAYGHGDQQVARLMEEVGADWLGVACYDEALSLRAAGIRLPILILGHTPVELCGGLAEQEITQAIFSPQYARDLRREAARPLVPRPVQIHNLPVFHPPRLLSFYWIRRKPGAAGHRFPPKKSPPWQKAPGELPPGKAVPLSGPSPRRHSPGAASLKRQLPEGRPALTGPWRSSTGGRPAPPYPPGCGPPSPAPWPPPG